VILLPHSVGDTIHLPGFTDFPSDAPAAPFPIKLENRGVTSHFSQDKRQAEFWDKHWAFWQTIVDKVRSCGQKHLLGEMVNCRQYESILQCRECGARKVITNRCEKRFCPLCGPRLARERTEEISLWSKTLQQPKHVVLTARNTAQIQPTQVAHFTKSLAALRRRKEAQVWKAGTWALETTNEGRGWHLHAHLLVESNWIDSGWLAKTWGRYMKQDYAVVKVKDARDLDYLQELLKYVVKSSELAGWEPWDICYFLRAFARRRSFGVFGSLVGDRARWQALVKLERAKRSRCTCGCNRYTLTDSRIAEAR
jgi:Transposase zinc-binding domain